MFSYYDRRILGRGHRFSRRIFRGFTWNSCRLTSRSWGQEQPLLYTFPDISSSDIMFFRIFRKTLSFLFFVWKNYNVFCMSKFLKISSWDMRKGMNRTGFWLIRLNMCLHFRIRTLSLIDWKVSSKFQLLSTSFLRQYELSRLITRTIRSKWFCCCLLNKS